ncbi:MAG: phosphoribosylformylglycinamidine synthase subunit PurS [Candidatus Dadabacteria bacterium]|nr:MAG: phosphoribosylformylglycinamidine synthase subunit PurS [Candidatus Dadabacteria bacterium]
MKAQVLVRLKPGVLDVQGKAVEHGLKSLGFNNVSDVRIGRLVEFEIESDSTEDARREVTEICEKLLANTIIENYEIRGLE